MKSMKKLLALAAAAVMTLSFAGCGSTDTADNTAAESDLAQIQAAGTMKIGYTIIEPLNYFDENNNLIGFETEFATAVCEKLGVEPEFIEINWSAKEVELNSRNIDCIWNGMTITPERQEAMSITTPYLANRQVLVVKAENEAAYTESIDGVTVIAEAGSTGEELALSDNEFFANANFTPVESQATALMDVAAGTSGGAVIDYVMAASSVGEGTSFSDLVLIDKGFDPQEYGVAFRKDSDVTEAVNAAMQELSEDGTLGQIAEKYNLTDLLLIK